MHREIIAVMKFSVLMVLITILSMKVYAKVDNDSVISGVVVSFEDNKAVAHATVFIGDGGKYAAIADEKGNFRISLPEGEHILTCSSMGYEDWSQAINMVKGDTKKVSIKLKRSDIEMDDVNVVGKSQTQLRQDQGYSVNNITTRQTSASSFTTEELLNRSAGVKIRQSGGIGSESEYSINGLSGSSVKVYIDGVPIRSYGHSFSVSNLPPSAIDRVEVFKGVVPAYLADDALGGAINIITKRGDSQSLNASYSLGSLNTHNFDINGLYTNEKSGFFVGGTAYYNSSDNNYKVWGDAVYVTDNMTGRVENITAERFNDQYMTYGAGINTGYTNLSWADELRLNLTLSNVDKEIQNGATMETVYGNRRSEQCSYVSNINYRKRDILPRLDLQSDFSYSYTDRTIIDTCNIQYDWSGKPVTDMNGDIVHWGTTGEAGRATLAASLENNFNNRTSIRYAVDTDENHIVSFSGSYYKFTRDIDDPMLPEYEQQLTDTRYIDKFTLAVAYDAKFFDEKLNVSLFYKYFNQNLSLSDPIADNTGALVPNKVTTDMDGNGYGFASSYELLEGFRVNLSAENALRLPTITEMIGNASENIEANYNIRPERSLNFNVGASLESISFGENSFGGSINLFYRDVTDMIQRAEINKGDETFGYENIGKILSKGVDLELKYSYKDRLRVTGAMSYTDARFNLRYDENGAEYAWYGDRLRNMPYFTTNGGVSYEINDLFQKGSKLMISYHLNYTHEFFKNWESLGVAGKATISSQLSHDIGVVYTFPSEKITFSIDGKNILNEQLFDNYALQKPGRLIFAKLSFRIL